MYTQIYLHKTKTISLTNSMYFIHIYAAISKWNTELLILNYSLNITTHQYLLNFVNWKSLWFVWHKSEYESTPNLSQPNHVEPQQLKVEVFMQATLNYFFKMKAVINWILTFFAFFFFLGGGMCFLTEVTPGSRDGFTDPRFNALLTSLALWNRTLVGSVNASLPGMLCPFPAACCLLPACCPGCLPGLGMTPPLAPPRRKLALCVHFIPVLIPSILRISVSARGHSPTTPFPAGPGTSE